MATRLGTLRPRVLARRARLLGIRRHPPSQLDYPRRVRTCLACIASCLFAAFVVACGVRSPLTDDLVFARADAAPDAPSAGASDAAAPREAGPPDAPADAPPDVALPAADLGNVVLSSG